MKPASVRTVNAPRLKPKKYVVARFVVVEDEPIEIADIGFDAFAERSPVYRSRPPAVPTPSW
jgi:hypothetical protein